MAGNQFPGLAALRLRALARSVGSAALFGPAVRLAFGVRNRHLRDIAFHAIKTNPTIHHLCVDGMHETMIVNCRDDVISRAVYRVGHFDFDKFERAVTILRDQRLIGDQIACLYDVGANIGTICVPAVTRGYVARAVAIEPHPTNARILRANIALNGLDDRIKVAECAAGAEDGGSVDLEVNERNWGDHRVAPATSDGVAAQGETGRKRIAVPMRSIDAIAADLGEKPDVLWMDTQGYEGLVLAGASAIIASGIPVVTEYWPYSLKRIGAFDSFVAAVGKFTAFIDLDVPDVIRPAATLVDHFAGLKITQGADLILFNPL